MELNCQGIVINSYDFRDKDKIIVLYTDSLGKIKVLARGVKSIKSRNRESILILGLSEYKLVKGRNFYYLQNSNLERGFKIKEYENYELACKIIKVLDKLLPEDYINPKIFRLTDNFLLFIENMPLECCDFVMNSYFLKLLYFLGNFPAFRKCMCGKNTGDKRTIDFINSVMYCEECSEKTSVYDLECDREFIKDINFILKWDYTFEHIFKVKKENIIKIKKLITDYINYHFHVKI